ncbi:amidase [Bradyrhizobium sp. U87765 SZCCT0131]|uniref:amidase n=1 Tax=unclassified Bradyrhizobium TaxID=2631580 RepID=UPI001BA6823E|nr:MULTISPECIES: amidase [unclassified Bradyrhizobium]MBR1216445.1 amidase [Bradyrhizobium sp. U87765 SZCCT0131]MBR1259806.1 amidase [Bradyrhizobium sp. U87765 SZCCT0134]MBR1305940.1 amidase [Bradyrhizobium sp. U87765 SZCCT0110]MBR1322307.1 amidase [Bradyrhizobium sp. U87765 SZCCT0109]MBR1352403.1 amidase [Bradyrhizobium sp. U87765 SZCCT0048]
MAFKNYDAYDGLGLAELVRKGDVSATELLDEAIARTERVDPQINAVVVRHDDYARRQIEAGLPQGPFTGVPFLLKDLELLAGTRTTFGARLLKDNVADHDGTFATRCLAAGVTIFGKTATPEFGLMPTTETALFGATRNPWNLDHSSGGSSGGAAAAVAARILPVAHASDGGGSIRIPASACGVFGLKPTRARTPLGPDRGEGWGGFSCNHVVSISVRDSAAMLDALHGPEPSSPYTAPPPERPYLDEIARPPGRLRIAFSATSPAGDALDPEVTAAVREVAALLESLGHHVEERGPKLPVNPAEALQTIVGANTALTVRLAEQRLGRAVTDREFERLTLASAANAGHASAVDYVAAQQAAFQISRALATFFEGCDVFLTPTLGTPPLRIGVLDTMAADLSGISPALRGYMPSTAMFNMSGQPAMSVPLAWSASGLPLGMMFAGRFGDEATLFRLAAQLEQARPWKDRRPPVCA